MAEGRDVTKEILAYLAGDAQRPTFDDLTAAGRDAARAELAAAEDGLKLDFDMIPSFDEDPVAVRLGLREGPEQARVYGPAIRHARQAAGLSTREIARVVSATGNTVDDQWVEELEMSTWRTISAAEAEAIAAATGAEPRSLGAQATPVDRIAAAVIAEHSQLTAIRFEEQFGGQFPDRILVSFLDLRILLIVVDGSLRDAALRFAIECVADADRYTAIGAVQDDEDMTTWIVRPRDVLEHYEAPDGAHRHATSSPNIIPTTLSLAIGDLIQGEVVRWPSFEIDMTVVDEDIDSLRQDIGQSCLKKYRASASRVAVDRRPAYATVGEVELQRAQDVIGRLLAGRAPLDAVALLDEIGAMNEAS
jgi:transcriptional regulator with XRE-family HTH domain